MLSPIPDLDLNDYKESLSDSFLEPTVCSSVASAQPLHSQVLSPTVHSSVDASVHPSQEVMSEQEVDEKMQKYKKLYTFTFSDTIQSLCQPTSETYAHASSDQGPRRKVLTVIVSNVGAKPVTISLTDVNFTYISDVVSVGQLKAYNIHKNTYDILIHRLAKRSKRVVATKLASFFFCMERLRFDEVVHFQEKHERTKQIHSTFSGYCPVVVRLLDGTSKYMTVEMEGENQLVGKTLRSVRSLLPKTNKLYPFRHSFGCVHGSHHETKGHIHYLKHLDCMTPLYDHNYTWSENGLRTGVLFCVELPASGNQNDLIVTGQKIKMTI